MPIALVTETYPPEVTACLGRCKDLPHRRGERRHEAHALEKLILNGDVIDGWALRRRGGWERGHTRFLRLVLKKTEKKGTEVVYTAECSP